MPIGVDGERVPRVCDGVNVSFGITGDGGGLVMGGLANDDRLESLAPASILLRSW
jgi:hypothetical protein